MATLRLCWGGSRLFEGAFSDGRGASGHTHAVCHAAYDQVALEQLLQTRVQAHAFLPTNLHHADLVVDRVVELCAERFDRVRHRLCNELDLGLLVGAELEGTQPLQRAAFSESKPELAASRATSVEAQRLEACFDEPRVDRAPVKLLGLIRLKAAQKTDVKLKTMARPLEVNRLRASGLAMTSSR